ncbi:unnamed protein product [Effrenium voratum]|nr:unnamed protein product [Effrenium voratum]
MNSRGYALLLPSRCNEPSLSPRGALVEPVTLHVYSVSGSETVRKVNRVLGKLRTGAFHTAVEVYGQEWSYGYTEKGSGVFCCNPKECDAHIYLYSVPMGHTSLSQQTILALMGRLAREWQGEDYDILRCNCCHFSNELLRRLGLGSMPKQFLSLASTGRRDAGGQGRDAGGAAPSRAGGRTARRAQRLERQSAACEQKAIALQADFLGSRRDPTLAEQSVLVHIDMSWWKRTYAALQGAHWNLSLGGSGNSDFGG